MFKNLGLTKRKNTCEKFTHDQIEGVLKYMEETIDTVSYYALIRCIFCVVKILYDNRSMTYKYTFVTDMLRYDTVEKRGCKIEMCRVLRRAIRTYGFEGITQARDVIDHGCMDVISKIGNIVDHVCLVEMKREMLKRNMFTHITDGEIRKAIYAGMSDIHMVKEFKGDLYQVFDRILYRLKGY